MGGLSNINQPASGVAFYSFAAGVKAEQLKPVGSGTATAMNRLSNTGSGHRSTLVKVRGAADEVLQIRNEMSEARDRQDLRDADGTRVAGSGCPYDATSPELLAKVTLAEHKLIGALKILEMMGYVVPQAEWAKAAKALHRVKVDLDMDIPLSFSYPIGEAGDSSWKIVANMKDVIESIATEYMPVYELAMEENKNFYTEFSDILADMGNMIDRADKENYVNFNCGALLSQLKALQKKYGTTKVFEHKDKKEAIAWAKRLGFPAGDPEARPPQATCVVKVGNVWVVRLDMKPVDTMIAKLRDLDPKSAGKLVLSAAKFQAWQAGFKTQEENLKNTMQTLSQKYSNGNDAYKNLLMVLSKLMESLERTDISFCQIG